MQNDSLGRSKNLLNDFRQFIAGEDRRHCIWLFQPALGIRRDRLSNRQRPFGFEFPGIPEMDIVPPIRRLELRR